MGGEGPQGILGLVQWIWRFRCWHHPYRGVYFGMYDTASAANPYKKDKGIMGILSKFAIAQCVAITAGYASYPFDTIRRRLQMQSEKPRRNGFTRALGTASRRSSKTRAQLRYSRALVQMRYAL